jgi:hypothetical protein
MSKSHVFVGIILLNCVFTENLYAGLSESKVTMSISRVCFMSVIRTAQV